MIEQPQQSTICMTVDEFDMIANNTFDNDFTQDLIAALRSRPAPSLTDFETFKKNVIADAIWWTQHDTAIAIKAREDVLDVYDKALWTELQGCGVSRGIADGIFLNARYKINKFISTTNTTGARQ